MKSIFLLLLVFASFRASAQADSVTCLPNRVLWKAIQANEKLKILMDEMVLMKAMNALLQNRVEIKDEIIDLHKKKEKEFETERSISQEMVKTALAEAKTNENRVAALEASLKKQRKTLLKVGGVAVAAIITSVLFAIK